MSKNPVGVPQSEEAPKIKEWMRKAERDKGLLQEAFTMIGMLRSFIACGESTTKDDDAAITSILDKLRIAGAQPLHAVEAPPNKVQEWMRRAARHWANVDNIVEEYAEIIAEEYWKAPGAQPLHVRSDREKEIVRKLRAEHDRLRSAAESSTEGGSLYAMAAKLNAVASEIERGE